MVALELKSPLMVELTVTEQCNHQCPHCYNPWRKREKKAECISIETLTEVIRKLEDAEVFHVAISGGEPLLHPDFLTIVDLFSSSKLSFSINSNLTCISEDLAQSLANKRLESILTSLPSSSEEKCDVCTGQKNSLRRIKEGISICRKHGIEVLVNCVITKTNVDTIKETGELAASLGCKYFAASVVAPPNFIKSDVFFLNGDDILQIANDLLYIKENYGLTVDTVTPLPLCVLGDIKKYLSILSRSCTAGITHMTIGANGEVHACSSESAVYGNMLLEDVCSIWKRMSIWREKESLHPMCRTCKYLDLCGGECRIISKTFPNHLVSLKKQPITNATAIQPSLSNYGDDEEFVLIPKMRFREERFGGVLNVRRTRNIIMSKTGVRIYNEIVKNQKNTISLLSQSFSKYQVLQFLAHLNANGAINRVE